MRIGEVLFSAMRGLITNKLRSALTTLGILIGVSAVIVLVALGNGASQRVMDSINNLGANTLTVYSGGRGDSTGRPLSVDDAKALAEAGGNSSIKAVVPMMYASGKMSTGTKSKDVHSIIGTHPGYFEISSTTVDRGTYFSKADVTESRKVIVIGPKLVGELFGGTDPVGAQVLINSIQFTVVGVLSAKGSDMGRGGDDAIYLPLTTVQHTLSGFVPPSQFMVQAKSPEAMTAAKAETESLLRLRHRIEPGKPADFEVSDPRQLMQASRSISRTFTFLLIGVAGISLLIGGVGITNIMLVTVTERTREIGIRKAIGATRGAILGQFLAESTMLSLFGGILGVVVGVVASQFPIMGLQPSIVPSSVALAFAVSALVGLFFGSLPANRASKLHPIQALRHE